MAPPSLTGTRVVDPTLGLAGPLTTMHPGGMGADVVRIAALPADGAAMGPGGP